MKKKKTAILTSLLSAGLIAASARFYMKVQEEQQKAVAIQEVRTFFADFGKIAVLFIHEEKSTKSSLSGGVVLEDGAVYLFKHHHGKISYVKETLCDL